MTRLVPHPSGLADRPHARISPFGLRTRVLVAVFGLLEWLSERRQVYRIGRAALARFANPEPSPGHRAGSLWVYVSTIGELNLIEPLLRRLLAQMPGTPVTLISDRPIYRDSYAQKYPEAYVYYFAANSRDTLRLAALTPPLGLLIVEIPCLLHDGPCRFPFAAVYEVKRRNAPVALLNGWLYGYSPSSLLDRIERLLFGRDYLRGMDLITVQAESVRDRLVAAGARREVVEVTGNTKFDAVVGQTPWSALGRPSERMLESLAKTSRPILVAGCVTDLADQRLLLDAFVELTARFPDALLVLAPRHPEKSEVMRQLAQLIEERKVPTVYRSQHGDQVLDPGVKCLVLDTFGELKDFYAISRVAFVGKDHNLLEPLSFGKQTVTTEGWEATFPSYPVYQLLLNSEAVQSAGSVQELVEICLTVFTRAGSALESSAILDLVSGLSGATEKSLPLLSRAFGLSVAN